MKWINSYKVFEARANPLFQAKVRQARAEVRKKIVTGQKLIDIINTNFLTQDYQNFCTKYYLNKVSLSMDKRNIHPITTKYDYDSHENNNFHGAKATQDVFFNEISDLYINNICGMARLLTDITTNSRSEELPAEETIKVDIGIERDSRMKTNLFFSIYAWKHMCQCNLNFELSYYGYKKVVIDIQEEKISRDITKEEVTETLTKCLQRAYQKLLDQTDNFNFDEVIEWAKKDLIGGIKRTISINDDNYTMIGNLKHYPVVMELLGLTTDDIGSADKMGEMGF